MGGISRDFTNDGIFKALKSYSHMPNFRRFFRIILKFLTRYCYQKIVILCGRWPAKMVWDKFLPKQWYKIYKIIKLIMEKIHFSLFVVDKSENIGSKIILYTYYVYLYQIFVKLNINCAGCCLNIVLFIMLTYNPEYHYTVWPYTVYMCDWYFMLKRGSL